MMDKKLIAEKFAKSLVSYDKEAIAQKKILSKLVDLLNNVSQQKFSKILEFGTGTGLLSQEVNSRIKFDQIVLNDLSEDYERFTLSRFSEEEHKKTQFLRGDIESIDLDNNFDLVISSSTEQWIENKELFYDKIYNSLNSEGLFVFSSFGPNNLKQIREATGVSLDYYSLEDTKSLLSEKFEILHSEEETISLEFNSALEILTHIKKTGVNAISKKTWTKKSVMQLLKKIEQVSQKGNKFEICYHPNYFILKKR